MLSQNFQPFAVRETNAFTHVVSLQHIYSTDCQDFAGCVSPFPYNYDKANPRYALPLRWSSCRGECPGLITCR